MKKKSIPQIVDIMVHNLAGVPYADIMEAALALCTDWERDSLIREKERDLRETLRMRRLIEL